MLYWSLKITIMSILLIFLVHYLINFFKSTLTIPKIKDLVNAPSQKYENMYNIISQKNNDSDSYTEIDLLPKMNIENANVNNANVNNMNVENMKNELKSFLKEQLQNSNKNDYVEFSTEISGKQHFSEYS